MFQCAKKAFVHRILSTMILHQPSGKYNKSKMNIESKEQQQFV